MLIRRSKVLIPEPKLRSNKSKIEIANEVGSTNNDDSYIGNLTSRDNGNKVKKMVEAYEQGLK